MRTDAEAVARLREQNRQRDLQQRERDHREARWKLQALRDECPASYNDAHGDIQRSISDLVRQRRFDAALRLCAAQLRDFPDVVDGLGNTAQVYEVSGDHARAAHFYRLALAFVQHPDRISVFDDSLPQALRERIRINDALAADAEALRARVSADDREP